MKSSHKYSAGKAIFHVARTRLSAAVAGREAGREAADRLRRGFTAFFWKIAEHGAILILPGSLIGGAMKNLFAAVCLGLAALLSTSCPNPSGPSPTPTSNYISFSINGGTATYYTSGMISGSSTLAVTTPGLPLASIPGTKYNYLILYASKSNADFEASGVDSIFISITPLPVASSPSIGAGSYLAASGEGANISLRIGATKYIAGGTLARIDLTLD